MNVGHIKKKTNNEYLRAMIEGHFARSEKPTRLSKQKDFYEIRIIFHHKKNFATT